MTRERSTLLFLENRVMNKRIVLVFGLFAISYSLVSWFSAKPETALESRIDLSVTPLELDGWRGEDVEIRDDTIQVLKSDSFINRTYRDGLGREMSIHIANWLNPDTISAAPHHPEICYPAAGWEIRERRTVQLATKAGEIPMELILFQRGQQRVVTGHWFQVGDLAFVSSDGFQKERHRFWGKRAWPSTTKFLLQTVASSTNAAEDRLKEFAKLVAEEFATDRAAASSSEVSRQ